jgi:DNA invertase Pin-like site-specific DNA recombinase
VTQQFNTTTSMARLTLNILLSFSQFEREVTGERIRDKVAASKTSRETYYAGRSLSHDHLQSDRTSPGGAVLVNQMPIVPGGLLIGI